MTYQIYVNFIFFFDTFYLYLWFLHDICYLEVCIYASQATQSVSDSSAILIFFQELQVKGYVQYLIDKGEKNIDIVIHVHVYIYRGFNNSVVYQDLIFIHSMEKLIIHIQLILFLVHVVRRHRERKKRGKS